ncbi:MAG: 6-pyruvoyl tetrahydrobiopterin synthase [candidate division Zixibacteria bacterium RBG_16_53_22]|nr:MAG: 6-pyruvoyl tetrahydrobiopterin synthase [candidate division Zixibacteria bacterium RBG_16_53_22]
MNHLIAERYHDISCGHRVYQHESKCAHLHGHNYRIHFSVAPDVGLDAIGRVLDFSVIKFQLCMWLEDNWDHKFLVWEMDPWSTILKTLDERGVVITPFNPTAENMAQHLAEVVGPDLLAGFNCHLTAVRIEETRKCSASYLTGRTL